MKILHQFTLISVCANLLVGVCALQAETSKERSERLKGAVLKSDNGDMIIPVNFEAFKENRKRIRG